MSDIADLRMISGLLRRQIWVVLATAAAILSLIAIVLTVLTPRYTAQALVVVDTSAKNLLAPDSAAIASASDNARVEGEVRIAQSDAVLLDVVREGKLADDPEFAPRSGYLTGILVRFGGASSHTTDDAERETLASFKEAVRVRREGLTYLITIGVTSEDAAKAALLANRVASVYIRHQIDAKVAGTIASRNSLQARVSAAKDSLASHEGLLDAFLAANAGMRDAFTNANIGLRVADAQLNRAATLPTSTPQPPAPSETLTQFYSLQQSAEIARAQYQNLLTRLQDFEAQASLQLADSRVISEALPPIEPSYPRVAAVLAVMSLVALGFGIGAGFLREFFVGGFTGEDQVEAVLNIQLASVVPHEEGGELERPHGRGLSDRIMTAPLSVFSESIRRIRVSVEQALLNRHPVTEDTREEGIVIMVSSSLPGEGKSTLATALARTYALAGKRTLLIDCDLRKPSIHRHVDREPTPAFVNLLRGEADPGLASMVAVDHATNLSVILGARPAEFATDELLMSARVRALLTRARLHFDYVVIDTPPVEAAVDALYLARLCDVALFVVRWARTPQNVARKAVTALKGNVGGGTPVIAVLNGQDQRHWFSFKAKPMWRTAYAR
ncbi:MULTISPECIES: Wzz/FepE/Etk N-terminal domain-containing protein [unclassified Rhizobium]|uniref:Wzz/FepE/Etk N-terminal domain-containing protein n=1 Tax=unclassified Rhizobium TaxID=2613769 RepID=UPI001ADAF64D|nr:MULTISPECIES: Wzz/FepE/Etk N-terminal domain-containing protein [unclassified Rhizobium]MBO9125311.1 P-loop NTPase [Rhizobium sp. 16-488-2b]MBO9175896.1 P-loop NTPase [Rhizobium sp. 16-488-2a]